jgi:hypothetical protein
MYTPLVTRMIWPTATFHSTQKRSPCSNSNVKQHTTAVCFRRKAQFPKPQRRIWRASAAKEPSDQQAKNNGARVEELELERPASVEKGAEVATNSGTQTAETEGETAQFSSSAPLANREVRTEWHSMSSQDLHLLRHSNQGLEAV